MQRLTITGLWVLAACTATEAPTFVVADSAGIQIVVSDLEAAPTWTLGKPTFQLGTVSGGPAEFHRIRDLRRLASGDLLVANAGSEELRVFSADGAHLRTIGKRGAGPGEFNGLQSATLLADSIVTYDNRNDRISVFTADGTYARSFRLEWSGGLLGPELIVP
ncbi:MAG: 6-bladed beta-propeller, partial [Longimicrobiales bacterium]